MKRIKFLAFLISLSLIWWDFLALVFNGILFFRKREKPQIQKFLSTSPPADCLIIFNSGGWGNTSLKKTTDFLSVVRGIKKELNQRGYSSLIVPYRRTKENLFSKVAGVKELLNFFRSQSRQLAKQINTFLKNNPNKKVIITGLSLGAHFVDETMRHVKNNPSVLVIKVGVPFWSDHFFFENVLEINREKDALAEGDTKVLFLALLKGIAKWIRAKLKGQSLPPGKAVYVPGHVYSWDSPFIREQIIAFLEKKFIPLDRKSTLR